MPVTMIRLNLVKGLGPVLQIAEGWTVKLPDEVTDKLMETYRLYMALHLVRTQMRWQGRPVQDCLRCNEQLGCKPRRHQLRPHRCRPDHPVLHAPYSGLHAQRSGREDLPSGCLERIRNGQRGRRFQSLQELWSAVQIIIENENCRPGCGNLGRQFYFGEKKSFRR